MNDITKWFTTNPTTVFNGCIIIVPLMPESQIQSGCCAMICRRFFFAHRASVQPIIAQYRGCQRDHRALASLSQDNIIPCWVALWATVRGAGPAHIHIGQTSDVYWKRSWSWVNIFRWNVYRYRSIRKQKRQTYNLSITRTDCPRDGQIICLSEILCFFGLFSTHRGFTCKHRWVFFWICKDLFLSRLRHLTFKHGSLRTCQPCLRGSAIFNGRILQYNVPNDALFKIESDIILHDEQQCFP